jgi:DNA-3-methyladenine glycosylase
LSNRVSAQQAPPEARKAAASKSSNVADEVNTTNNRAIGVARKGLPVLTRGASAKWERVFGQPTAAVARALIGASLYRVVPPEQSDAGTMIVGRIVETEAYLPLVDPACHAYRGPTPRTAVMFGRPGYAYVYFVYGNHFCVNVTTERAGIGGAVLIRAVEPVRGIEAMRRRRPAGTPDAALACGPGNLCRAFAIDRSCSGADLSSGPLRIEFPVAEVQNIVAGPRIGIRAAADWPLRFVDPASASVSPFRLRASVSAKKGR